jgi:hypothetical protein
MTEEATTSRTRFDCGREKAFSVGMLFEVLATSTDGALSGECMAGGI